MVQLAPKLPEHWAADLLRLAQVLSNFTSNATKFTERGEARISVSQPNAAEPVLRLAVSDTGVGLSAEQQGRLWQSFAQAGGNTTRRYGGSGLDLVITKRLAALIGGELACESSPDCGFTVWFTARLLPASAAPTADWPALTGRHDGQREPRGPLGLLGSWHERALGQTAGLGTTGAHAGATAAAKRWR